MNFETLTLKIAKISLCTNLKKSFTHLSRQQNIDFEILDNN